jgi:hypothetical protein
MRRTSTGFEAAPFGRRVGKGASTLAGLAAVAVAVVAGCTPPPTGPAPDPAPPVIRSFTGSANRSTAPVTATYGWSISDPNGDTLTCRLDIDGDGSWDHVVSPCSSSTRRLGNFTTPGTRVATLEVDDGTFAPVTATAAVTVGDGPSESFAITVRPTGMREDLADAFQAAADRWAEVIAAGLPDVPFTLSNVLVPWAPPFSGVVDDVLIDATAVAMDGPGGTLGQATPLAFRGDGTPYYGIMQFDVDDLDRLETRGRLHDTIVHEMGHILGMGLSWALRGLVTDLLTTPRYVGPAANAAYQQLGGQGLIPVEAEGGFGTALAHWSEDVFGDEVMTGYSDPPPSPLSIMTVGALADLGYGVDLSAADPYVLPSLRTVRALAQTHDPLDDVHSTTDPLPR